MMFHMTFYSADFQYVLMFNMLLTSIHTVPHSLNTEQWRFSLGGGLCNEKCVTDGDSLACPGILREPNSVGAPLR